MTLSTGTNSQKKAKLGFSLLAAFLIAVSALLLFGWLSEEVFEGETETFDAFVRNGVHQFATPGLTHILQAFSVFGSVAVVTSLCLSVICGLFFLQHASSARLLAITMVGAGGLDIGLKHAFHRARPVAFFGMSPGSYSFPSGHALGSLCFYGALAAILSARAPGRGTKVCIWMGAAALIAMIGLSRIYLGVHYPSDVVAGYCAAAAWVGMVAFVHRTVSGASGT